MQQLHLCKGGHLDQKARKPSDVSYSESRNFRLPQSGLVLWRLYRFRHNRQWPKLVRYLDHADMPPDNNRVENAIRPFAVGRRSWMFCDTQGGARASANLYSLVLSARANGLEPLEYLTHIYTQLPAATTVEHFEALLPWNVKVTFKQAAAAKPSLAPTPHQTGRPKTTTRLIETVSAD